jgi:psiF repeat
MRSLLIIATLVASLDEGSALAQSTTPSTQHTPAVSQTTAKPTITKAPTQASIECSKQADAKGLHGKARKHFRSECRKHLMQKS